ncbi:MAG: hypothetical protein AB7E72_12935 [Lysobacterales bacterium]
MSLPDRLALAPSLTRAELLLPTANLDAALAFYVDQLGFRLEMIMPADAPQLALVSGYGIQLRLDTTTTAVQSSTTPLRLRLPLVGRAAHLPTESKLISPDGVEIEWADLDQAPFDPPAVQEFVLSCATHEQHWVRGRAGMRYRDLLPGRFGGRFIASHIRIEDGGPVPDYVHYHEIQLQLIYCHRGWVRVVYEDQGEPFLMRPGDCVLQPPTIRHRVLEASAGLEVIEFGSPAIHPTRRDHDLELPSAAIQRDRRYGGQHFIHHQAATAVWQRDQDSGLVFRDLGIAKASAGLADLRVWRIPGGSALARGGHDNELQWYVVLAGELGLSSPALGQHRLASDDTFSIPAGADCRLSASSDSELLALTIPV